MMDKNNIKEVIVDKTTEIVNLCSKVGIDFDDENIHKFRVAFKYLRSFLRLLRLHNDDKGLRMPDKMKELYFIAGNIRDTQLALSNLGNKELELPSYFDKLNKRLDDLKRDWKNAYSEKSLHYFLKQVKNTKFQELPVGILTNFLNTRLASIDETIKIDAPTDLQIHSIRKDAKDIIYATDAATKNKWGKAEEETKNIPIEELNQVADEIGEYNNQRLQLESISQFGNQATGEEEKEQIKKMKRQQKPKIQKKKKNIISLVKGLFIKEKMN